MGKELHGPYNAFLASLQHKNAMAMVVLRSRTNVTAVNDVRHSGAVSFRCFIQENLGTRGRGRCFITVEGFVEECFGQELWVDSRGAQKIESCGDKRNQAAPQMHGKVGMYTAQVA